MFVIIWSINTCGIVLSSFIASSELAGHLNAWENFANEFSRVFGDNRLSFTKVDTFSRKLTWFIALLISTIVPWCINYNWRCGVSNFWFDNNCSYLETEQAILLMIFGPLTAIVLFLAQCKVMLMLFVCTEALSQISNQFDNQCCVSNGSKCFVGKTKLWKVISLTYMVRRQVRWMNRVCGTSQFIFIIHQYFSFVLSWLGLVSLLRGQGQLEATSGAPFVVGSGIFETIRFLVVAGQSEMLLCAETKLLGKLMRVRNWKLQEQIEVIIICLYKIPCLSCK